MILRLLLLLVVLGALLWQYQHIRKMPKHERKKHILKLLFWLVLSTCVIAVLFGKLHWLGAALAALLGLSRLGLTTAFRLQPFFGLFRQHMGNRHARFTTDHLEVCISFKTGDIDGRVTRGRHLHCAITELSQQQLTELARDYKDRDLRSYYLIKVLQKRLYNTGYDNTDQNNTDKAWSQNNGGHTYPSELDESQAKQILGLDDNYQKQDIVKAHRKLMQKLHPDRGGNDYLAAQVNLAKEVLLNAKNNSA